MKKQKKLFDYKIKLKNKINREYLKERIYGSITILALNLSIYANIEKTNLANAFFAIITTSIWLWLASIFSESISGKVLDENKSKKERKENLINSLWILASTKMSIVMIIIAFLWFINLKTAILTSIITTIVYFIFLLYFASIKKQRNILFWLFVFLIQILVFIVILNLKIGH